MTDDNFFDIGGGTSAPSAKLKDLNDYVIGTVVESYKRDFVPFGQQEAQVISDPKTGERRARQQMVVILQTDERNWARVSKVPKVDPSDKDSAEKAPSEDDGTRAVYIPEMVKGAGHNGFIFAVGQAVQAAKLKGLPEGTVFKARIAELKDTGKGNPLKVYEVVVEAPAPAGDFFGQQQAAPAQQAPAPQAAPPAPQPAPQQAAPAPAQQDPWSGAPAPQAAPPAQQDPWATGGQAAPSSTPPF